MGLDVGIIKITYLERPSGWAYRFARELAIHASTYGYMHGDGNSWGPFAQREVLRMLDNFAVDKDLDSAEKAQVLAWVRSLPWEGWREGLDASADDDGEDDEDPVLDHDPSRDGGLIELHFNW